MIEVYAPWGGPYYFRYIEEIASWLTRWYGREVLVSDYEGQLRHECDFIVFGDTFHYTCE